MMSPWPNRPARGSRSGRPVMALLDLLGRRMTLRILWELSRHPMPMTFRMLQEAAETNPAVLNARLRELRATRLVRRDELGYVLAEEGEALAALLLPLISWANEWASRFNAPSPEPAPAARPKTRASRRDQKTVRG